MPFFAKRLIRWIGFFVAVLIAFPALLFLGWVAKASFIDNPRYATKVFALVFPTFDVLESRQWHPLGASGWGCSYAIVALPHTIPTEPPEGVGDISWQFRWGFDDWQSTPMRPLGDTTRDAVDACAGHWRDGTSVRIRKALAEPGSFAIVGPVGETVFVYSKPYQIAARIRYGD